MGKKIKQSNKIGDQHQIYGLCVLQENYIIHCEFTSRFIITLVSINNIVCIIYKIT